MCIMVLLVMYPRVLVIVRKDSSTEKYSSSSVLRLNISTSIESRNTHHHHHVYSNV